MGGSEELRVEFRSFQGMGRSNRFTSFPSNESILSWNLLESILE